MRSFLLLTSLLVLSPIFFISCENSLIANRIVLPKNPRTTPLQEKPKPPQIFCKESTNLSKYDNAPIVVMLSIDGFRADYMQKYNPPNLKKIMKAGIYTKGMIPSFPSLTFPNHYTLATGRSPGHHGIVSNKFYDKSRKQTYNFMDPTTAGDGTWYKGEPLWNTAEKNGMIAHTYHWVGSESHIENIDPTCYAPYDYSITTQQKIDTTIKWLQLSLNKRPHLINIYTSIVDSAGHKSGPDSDDVKNAIEEVDTAVGNLWDFINQSNLPINFVIVSDHGMQTVDVDHVIYLSNYVSDLSGFTFGDRGAVVMMYNDDPEKVQAAYSQLKENEKNYKVYLKGQTPAEYVMDDMDRTGDIIVVADLPYFILDRSFTTAPKLNAATHGWAFTNPEMHALFIAAGPNVVKNKVIPSFSNTDVYPFVLNILGISTNISNDGNPETLRPYIR